MLEKPKRSNKNQHEEEETNSYPNFIIKIDVLLYIIYKANS